MADVQAFLDMADAVNRDDLETFVDAFDPDGQFEPQLAELQGSYEGQDGVRGFLADIDEIYEEFRVNYPDVRDLGDQVLALGIASVRTRGTGIEQEVPLAIVATFSDGRITHFKDFGDRDLALKAVGLTA